MQKRQVSDCQWSDQSSFGGRKNFTKEEIQDLEDAIHFACDLIALREELGTWENPERIRKFVTRLMQLKTQARHPRGDRGGQLMTIKQIKRKKL